MHPKEEYVANLDEYGMYVILDEWGYHLGKRPRTATQRQAIQQKWNERLKRRLQKEVGELGSNSGARKM